MRTACVSGPSVHIVSSQRTRSRPTRALPVRPSLQATVIMDCGGGRVRLGAGGGQGVRGRGGGGRGRFGWAAGAGGGGVAGAPPRACRRWGGFWAGCLGAPGGPPLLWRGGARPAGHRRFLARSL